MSEELRAVLDFVEGRVGAKQFETSLYQEADSFEQLFRNGLHSPAGSQGDEGLFLYLVSQNYDDPDGVLYVQEALAQFLTRNGIAFTATGNYERLATALLACQPQWLDVDPAYLQREVLSGAGGRTGAELEHWLRKRLLELFHYVWRPPNWVQNPEWPIGKNGPLLFIGQLEAGNSLEHGETFYLFYDPLNGDSETRIQVQC